MREQLRRMSSRVPRLSMCASLGHHRSQGLQEPACQGVGATRTPELGKSLEWQ